MKGHLAYLHDAQALIYNSGVSSGQCVSVIYHLMPQLGPGMVVLHVTVIGI